MGREQPRRERQRRRQLPFSSLTAHLGLALAPALGDAGGGAATLPTVADLLARTYIADVAIAPDGERVLAFLIDGNRPTELKLLELAVADPAAPPVVSPLLPNQALRSPIWSRAGTAAFVVRPPPLAEVWIVPPGESARPALFPDQSGEVFDLFWTPNGADDELLVLRNEAGVGVREAVLRRVDRATREVGAELLRLGALTVREATLSPDGAWLAVTGTLQPNRSPEGEPIDLFVVEVASGVVRRMTDGGTSVDRPAFAPDGGAVACAQRAAPTLLGAAKRDLVRFDLATGLRRNLTRERGWSLGDGVNGFQEEIHFLADGALATVTQDGLADHVLRVGPERRGSGVPPAGFASAGLRSWQRLRVAANGTFVAIESTPTEPERIVVGDVEDWRPRPLLEPNAVLRERLDAQVEVVAFHGVDGLAMEGLLLAPRRRPAPWPTVFVLHGGSAGRHTARFNDAWAQAFVAAGFAVFAPNLRGSAGYSLDFERAIEGDFGGAELSDLDRAVESLVERGSADPERLYLHGHSYGGFLVELALTRTGRFAAAVAAAAVSDWRSYVAESDLPRLASIGLGASTPDSERLRLRSPLTHAAQIGTPLLLQHGERDRRVPYTQSLALQRAIVAAGGVCELRSESTEAHLYRDRASIAAAVEEAIAWFAYYPGNSGDR